MKLFKKEKIKDINKDYSTIKEYFNKIERIQNNELKSERYVLAYSYLSNNYWNRENKDLEEELFKIIGLCGLEDSLINESSEYKKLIRLERYEKLKQFINSLSEEQINSNLFLKKTSLFMDLCEEDCSNIMYELYKKINGDNVSKSYTLELPIPNKIQEHIPNYIKTSAGIKYYNPKQYKVDYINILDKEHKYVYEDYNTVVEVIGKLAEDIYFLQLNNILFKNSSIRCNHFYVYHPGYNNHLIASFFVNMKQNDLNIQKNDSKLILKKY